ncbi:hypothetical protein BH23GEM3_BH23GEM3_13300 [soil metagenome]
MRESSFLSEAQLANIERPRDPETIPHLVSAIRQQQHDLDSLRLSSDVSRRDREELRSALLAAQEEIRRLQHAENEVGGEPEEPGEPASRGSG